MSSSVMSCRARASRASPLTASTRTLLVNRAYKSRDLQYRCLWWWSRHGSWSTTNEPDALEERLRRTQKIMKHRYSRVLERRSTWERANSPHHWRWARGNRLLARAWACKPLSTSDNLYAKIKEEEHGIPKHDEPWEQLHKDFEAYKAAIDKAIARDPYAVLFGRRLRMSANGNNSSWSSFSNLFRPHETEPEAKSNSAPPKGPIKIEIVNVDKKPSARSVELAPDRMPASESQSHSSQPDQSEEYVYDPISGRKVLAALLTQNQPESGSPQKSILETLFCEHTPTDAVAASNPSDSKATAISKPKNLAFENSRTREYNELRAASIGTNIDTTTAFSAKYEAFPETEVEKPSSRRPNTRSDEEETPLFAGTTYESKDLSHKTSPAMKPPTTSLWLQKEGFGRQDKLVIAATGSSSTLPKNRLEPAFDRIGSHDREKNEKKYVTKLQPAMDRMQISKDPEPNKLRAAPLAMTAVQSSSRSSSIKASVSARHDLDIDTREDLDLLRASDVRAATKTSRVTKQETARADAEARSKLEVDFMKIQKDAEVTPDVESVRAAVKNSKDAPGAQSVVKHMQRYPDGVVARTIQSMGLINDNFKKYKKSGETRVDLTEKLELAPEALERLPSIYKESKSKLDSSKAVSSAQALSVEKERAEATELLRASRERTTLESNQEKIQIQNLADTIKNIVQDHTDLVRGQHMDTSEYLLPDGISPGGFDNSEDAFTHELIKTRETPQNVQKSASKVVESISKVSSARQAQESSEQKHQFNATSGRSASSQLVEPRQAEQHKQTGINEDAFAKTIELATTKATPVPAITSPYIILTYNNHTREVDVTHLNKLIGFSASSVKLNPISVMSELGNAAAFVMRFAELERAGYSLMGGGGDVLIFQKQAVQSQVSDTNAEALEPTKSIKAVVSEIRSRIAMEEAQSQPPATVSPVTTTKKAATVLDQIPSHMSEEGTAPSPKSSSPPAQYKKNRDGPKVRRQEHVFSGTIRPNASEEQHRRSSSDETSKSGPIVRAVRMLERAVLIIVALGGTAYVIGVIAEGKDANRQYQQASIEGRDDNHVGPRRKIVMPSSRLGFYGTENARE